MSNTKDQALPTHASDVLDLTNRRIHFVGIGGCGMSGLAHMVQQRGAACSGTDMVDSSVLEDLRQSGIKVELDQTARSLPQRCDLVVISAAIGADHAEVVEARRRGISILKYAQLLGRLMVGRRGVAIAGTHGKSTTTSLLSHVLIQCGLDPSLIVGADCPQIGGGWRVGQSDLLIVEACEYDRSFHNLYPTHGIILNVEEDHLDIYRGIDEIVEAFTVFAARLPGTGTLLIQHEMLYRLAITAGLDCPVETIGFAPQADWRVEVSRHANGRESASRHPAGSGGACDIIRLYERSQAVAQWRSPLPGEHMAYNAAAAVIMAHRLGADWPRITEAVESFAGLERRVQTLGQCPVPHGNGQITVVDDYGHHPTEIDTTLRALRRHYSPKRLICVFQPHQHSRTRFLMERFAASFNESDLVIVPHIYFVRDSEKERHAVRAADLVDRLRRRGKQAMHLYPFGAIVEQLQLIVQAGDLLVTMGAGDVWKVAHGLMNSLERDRPIRSVSLSSASL